MMEKRTNTGTGRKRLSLVFRANEIANRRYEDSDFAAGYRRASFFIGYLAGWRAAKREAKR